MDIAIDFDGSVVTHEYPLVGKDIGAIPVLKELILNGHKLILNTMRSDSRPDGTNPLADAVDWFSQNSISLYGINANPTQTEWTSSPKVYAKLYIDDAGVFMPLVYPENGDRPYINWVLLRKELVRIGLIKI